MSDCWWQHLPDDQEVPQELLDELEAQIARHEEATRLAKQREKEAQEAKLRAEKSQREMKEMMLRFENVKQKVASASRTLSVSSTKVSRQAQLTQTLEALKARAAGLVLKNRGIVEEISRQKAVLANNADLAEAVENLKLKLAESKEQEKGECSGAEANENEAEVYARRKEEEAAEMRRKVEEMQKLLSERKLKLRQTEEALEVATTSTADCQKMLHSRQRRAQYIEKKKLETLLFEMKPSKKYS